MNKFDNLMRISFFFYLIMVLSNIACSQIKYQGKIETGYLNFQRRMIRVDPGPGWKGYNLNKDQNGVDISLINGIALKEKIFVGIGLGYLNFEGINGVSIFGDFDYLPLKKKISPILNLKIGYSRINNQYENGTGTVLAEFGGGVNYKLKQRLSIYLKSGVLFTQQSSFIPLRCGVKF